VQFVRDSALRAFGIKITAKGKASYFAETPRVDERSVQKIIGGTILNNSVSGNKGRIIEILMGHQSTTGPS